MFSIRKQKIQLEMKSRPWPFPHLTLTRNKIIKKWIAREEETIWLKECWAEIFHTIEENQEGSWWNRTEATPGPQQPPPPPGEPSNGHPSRPGVWTSSAYQFMTGIRQPLPFQLRSKPTGSHVYLCQNHLTSTLQSVRHYVKGYFADLKISSAFIFQINKFFSSIELKAFLHICRRLPVLFREVILSSEQLSGRPCLSFQDLLFLPTHPKDSSCVTALLTAATFSVFSVCIDKSCEWLTRNLSSCFRQKGIN